MSTYALPETRRTRTRVQSLPIVSVGVLTLWLAVVALVERVFAWVPPAPVHQYAWYALVAAGLGAAIAFAAQQTVWMPLAAASFAALVLTSTHWLSATGGLYAASWLTCVSALAVACIHARSSYRNAVVERDGSAMLATPFTFLISLLFALLMGTLSFGIGSTLLARHDRRRAVDDDAAAPATDDDVAVPAPRSLAELVAELDGLVGLAPVKEQVRNLVDFIQVQQERARRNLPTEPITLHLAFKGSSGVGKTMVARLVAQIYYALGLLPTAKVVEKQAGDLTAGYVRQTAAKANAACDEANGGVLFLDEIDALIPTADNDFAREANKALLARTENDRAQFALIIAGYTEAVEAYLATDPGWESRIPRRIEFPPYSAAELVEITKRAFCAPQQYELDASAETALETEFLRYGSNGGGRLARNIFEGAKVAQPSRLRASGKTLREFSDGELATLTGDDIRTAIAHLNG